MASATTASQIRGNDNATDSERINPPGSTLFLPSDDSDVDNDSHHRKDVPHAASSSASQDILDLFADVPDDMDDMDDAFFMKPLGSTVDVAALEREARARQAKTSFQESQPSLTPHQILPSSSPPRDTGEDAQAEDAKKAGKGADIDARKPGQRKKIARLDEGRLVGKDGFPALIKQVKGFTIKGKGHEAEDLDRLFLIYQFWAHTLYPKTQFRDTVERVEKLCHSRRMNVALSVYRDEAQGKKLEHGDEVIDLTDGENIEDKGEDPPPSEPASSRAPSQRPSSAHEQTTDFDDDEFEAAIREEEQRRQRTEGELNSTSAKPKATFGPPLGDEIMDVDGETWDQIMGGTFDDPTDAREATTTHRTAEDDDDIWDIVDEVEKERREDTRAVSRRANISEAEENWEDMYL